MSALRSACFALLAATLISSAASARPDHFAALNAALETEARDLMLPGVSAAVVENGRVVWTRGFGWADIEAHAPVTPRTTFNIASLTKPMTAVMLMQLVQRSELALDTPMRRYDSNFTDERITVGHVLSMTSESDPPGQRYNYNGNIYAELGHILTSQGGHSLPEVFARRLIEPLALRDTAPGPVAPNAGAFSRAERARFAAIMARLAQPYRIYAGRETVRAVPPAPELDAAANVVSTASDYARFAASAADGRLLGAEAMARMWTPVTNAAGERLPYAYGWFVEDYRSHRLIWHHGYYPNAYSALVLIVPERRLVFVALANADGLSAPFYWTEGVEGNTLACAFLRTYVDAALPCADVAAAAVARWRAGIPAPRPEIASDPAQLQRFSGAYRFDSGTVVTIIAEGDRLWWRSPSGGRYQLFQEAGNRFFMKADDRQLAFVSDASSGQVTHIDLTIQGVHFTLSPV
jgi:CubicO group peptidase (beta-lactamase class C family)